MVFEITVKELSSDRTANMTLPANQHEINDILDKAHIYGETVMRISRCGDVPELENFNFSDEPTFDELNYLAKRINELSDTSYEITAYRGLLQYGFQTINDAISLTYGTESVAVYPCRNFEEYGKFLVENGLCDENELVRASDGKVDYEKIGRNHHSVKDNFFINDSYVLTDSYCPEIEYDGYPEKPENWVFKLEIIGTTADIAEKKTETLTLPVDEECMQSIAESLGEKNIEDCISIKFESMIPQINSDTWSMKEIYSLNDIARDFLELSREDAAKFKAALESEQPQSFDKIESIMNYLDNYEFNHTLDRKAYAEEFNARILPPNLYKNVFSIDSTDELGAMILAERNCKYTHYGIISEYGGSLFPTDDASQQEQGSNIEIGGHCGI